MKPIKIKFTEYNYECGYGCCDMYKTITEVNGVEMQCHNQDVETIVKQILEHLGYTVEIENVWDSK
jgi:hypothetical protein